MKNTAGAGGGTSWPREDLAGQYVLYRHYAKNGTLLYAGRTNNPPARLGKHRNGAAWWSQVAWTTYEKFPSLEALKAAETWAIEDEHPKWNIQGKRHQALPRENPEPGFDKYRPIATRDLKPDIRLVHPLSSEFSVYGGDDTLRRAREWALRNRYYLMGSGPVCAHVFYLMECPNAGSRCLPCADHTQVWIPAPDFRDFERHSGAGAPFILTQPYLSSLPDDETAAVNGISSMTGSTRIPAEMAAYATAHGLILDSYPWDAWYYPDHCVPIRLSADNRRIAVFPLELEALSLMCTWRDDWPETVPEWLQ